MNMKIRNMIAMVCVITGLTAGITQAATLTLTPDLNVSWRYDQYFPSGVKDPAAQFRTYPIGNGLTGLVAGDNADYRTIWQFKLDTLGITSDDVISATLNWTGNPISGGFLLGIDGVNSNFEDWNAVPMYGGGAPITNFKFNNSGSNELTAAFNFALDNSTATSGLALRFYIEGASPAVNVYGNISNVNIVVTTVPEPSTYALVLGGIATLFLIRRRVQA